MRAAVKTAVKSSYAHRRERVLGLIHGAAKREGAANFLSHPLTARWFLARLDLVSLGRESPRAGARRQPAGAADPPRAIGGGRRATGSCLKRDNERGHVSSRHRKGIKVKHCDSASRVGRGAVALFVWPARPPLCM